MAWWFSHSRIRIFLQQICRERYSQCWISLTWQGWVFQKAPDHPFVVSGMDNHGRKKEIWWFLLMVYLATSFGGKFHRVISETIGVDDGNADEDSLNIWCVQWPIPALVSRCFNLLGSSGWFWHFVMVISFIICNEGKMSQVAHRRIGVVFKSVETPTQCFSMIWELTP